MTKYRISGVWVDTTGVITHYAFHTVGESSVSRAAKKSKSEAIRLLETRGNTATTYKWNYQLSKWDIGETVEVVDGRDGKFLRTNPNETRTDNLGHLIDFDWIAL